MIKEMISEEHEAIIAEAAAFLNHPHLRQSILSHLGQPFEAIHSKLPELLKKGLGASTEKSLGSALRTLIASLQNEGPSGEDLRVAAAQPYAKLSKLLHTSASALTGALGGFIGPWSLPFELPLFTSIMLRGIASVALDWGHTTQEARVQLECMFVFTLGSRLHGEGEEALGIYLGTRAKFAELLEQAADFMAATPAAELLTLLEERKASPVQDYLVQVAGALEVSMTEKLLIESMPFFGAVGGATINALFSDYFQAAARHHFALLHLEQRYGAAAVYAQFRKASGFLS